MMERKSFVFYESFYEASKYLSNEDKGKFLDMVCLYGFHGIEPEGEGPAMGMFLLVKPIIDSNNKKFINGCKGGAPVGNKNAVKSLDKGTKQPKTTKNNQKQPDVDVDVDVDVDKHTCPSKTKTTDISKKKTQYSQEFEEIWRTYPQNGGKKQDMFKARNGYSESEHEAFLFGAKYLCLYWNFVRYGETRMSQRIDRRMDGYVKPEDWKSELISIVGLINNLQDDEVKQKGLDKARELFGEDYVRGALIKASGKISLDLH